MRCKADMGNEVPRKDEETDRALGLNLCILPPIFERIRSTAESFLRGMEQKSSEKKELEYLVKCFSKHTCPMIDYDTFGETFTRWFFLENFVKAASTFFQEPPPLVRHIADLGSGSGATALAYLVMLNEQSESQLNVKIDFVDTSQRHLDLARRILDLVAKKFEHLSISPRFVCAPIQAWEPEERNVDAILLGHVLNENRLVVRELLERALSLASDNGRIYVIERDDDTVWKVIRDSASDMAVPTRYGTIDIETNDLDNNQCTSLPRHPTGSDLTHLRTSFLIIRLPERKQLARLLRLYFDAWQKQSIELLEAVFAPSALYYEKPYEEPYRGIEEIKRYWKENVLTQAKTHTKILRVAYSSNEVFAEWEASFVRHKQKTNLMGALILTSDAEGQKVTELREYFQTRRTPM